jgi:hypothetical protein
MNAGDTFIDGLLGHLWIIISDPASDAENLVIVNVTTYNAEIHDSQPQCVLQKGEHPFLTNAKSVIQFEDARVISESDLQRLLAAKQMKARAACSAALLKRVREEASKLRKRIPGRARRTLQDQRLI